MKMSREIENLMRQQEELFLKLKGEHFDVPFDNDGYPTDGALELISNWSYKDQRGWFDFCKSIWSYPDRWIEKSDSKEIHCSTGGWSGNESIIAAMKQNWVLWSTSWYSSQRGGHHVFDISRIKDE